MPGPTSPGGEGPTFAPPQLPPGWIAQWDANSKKYYFVQLSTGLSQWDTPTEAAPVGGTPSQNVEHPYGVPSGESKVITHADGTKTRMHPDGTMVPILSEAEASAVDGRAPPVERGFENEPTGERGFGTMAMNALFHGKPGGSGFGGQNSGGLSGLGGKLVGQLASNFFSSNRPQQPQNYYGGPPPQQQQQSPYQGGMGGPVMQGMSHMFGGQPQGGPQQNYGYSNPGQTGGYSGQAPPPTYQEATHYPPPTSNLPPPGQPYPPMQGQAPMPPISPYGQSPTQPQQHHTPSYPPPIQHAHAYGQPQQTPTYGQNPNVLHSVPAPPVGPPPAQYGMNPGPPAGIAELYSPPPGPPPPAQPQQQGYDSGAVPIQHQQQQPTPTTPSAGYGTAQAPYQGPTYTGGSDFNPPYLSIPPPGPPPPSSQSYPSQSPYGAQPPPIPHATHPSHQQGYGPPAGY